MENKIIFTGPVGAGKTTAINAISDIRAVATEARASDDVVLRKDNTTVAMDYGVLNLPGGGRVHLYGTPGQDRFNFMWEILGAGALGFVILLDALRPDPVADLEAFLASFRKPIDDSGHGVVIGITRTEEKPCAELHRNVHERLEAMGLSIPVFEVDGRNRGDIRQLLLALLALIDPTVSYGTA